jgi:hypothetical protein
MREQRSVGVCVRVVSSVVKRRREALHTASHQSSVILVTAGSAGSAGSCGSCSWPRRRPRTSWSSDVRGLLLTALTTDHERSTRLGWRCATWHWPHAAGGCQAAAGVPARLAWLAAWANTTEAAGSSATDQPQTNHHHTLVKRQADLRTLLSTTISTTRDRSGTTTQPTNAQSRLAPGTRPTCYSTTTAVMPRRLKRRRWLEGNGRALCTVCMLREAPMPVSDTVMLLECKWP